MCYIVKDNKKYIAKEHFVTFIHTRDTIGEKLSNTIFIQFFQWGFDPTNVRYGYDGAGHISDHTKGEEGWISSQNPRAKYVHC